MLNDQSILEISEILGSFDLTEIEFFVNSQILGDEDISAPYSDTVDHLHPLYLNYRELIDSIDDPEIILAINDRFEQVCNIFLSAIKKKYCIEVSEDWINLHPNSLAAVTIALYSFLVLNHQDNVEEVLYNYIITHKEELYNNFESLRGKKDASTLLNRKSYDSSMAVIFANIYDVCTYILDHITPGEFFDSMDQDYVPLQLLSTMYEDGNLGGVYGDDLPLAGKDFTDCIAETFRNNTSYKGVICFNVLDKLKRWAESNTGKDEK